jgi:hypothetical protein
VSKRIPATLALTLLSFASSGTARAQESPAASDSVRPPGGAELRIPLGSFFVPGIGQYLRGSVGTGAIFTATALGGYALYFTGDTADVDDDLPRSPGGQQAVTGLLLVSGSGMLSTYDAFRSAIPALQREGKYRFLTNQASTAALLSAPFDPEFLTRWTTWVHLAYTGVVAAVVLNARKSGRVYEPYTARDAAFLTGLSLSAGIGEEAMFRGWLFPLLHQTLDERFWFANSFQAATFGALHLPQAEEFSVVIALWAFYEGWLTRRNGWNIRESIFHHFWYDAIVATAEFLTQERGPGIVVRLPTIRF